MYWDKRPPQEEDHQIGLLESFCWADSYITHVWLHFMLVAELEFHFLFVMRYTWTLVWYKLLCVCVCVCVFRAHVLTYIHHHGDSCRCMYMCCMNAISELRLMISMPTVVPCWSMHMITTSCFPPAGMHPLTRLTTNIVCYHDLLCHRSTILHTRTLPGFSAWISPS